MASFNKFVLPPLFPVGQQGGGLAAFARPSQVEAGHCRENCCRPDCCRPAGASHSGWSGLGSAARGRARLPLGTLWFFLSPRKWFRGGFGKVGPWWGRGWEDGVARLGAERLGLWSGVGSAGGRPQLRGAHCIPGSAAAARAQVMVASRGFSPLVPSAPAAHPEGRRPCGSLMLPPAHPFSSPAPPLSLPLYFSLASSPRFSPRHPARVHSDQPRPNSP